MLVQRDVVVDPVLSNVSIAFKNENYIADLIMPVVPVLKETGKYYKYDKANFRRAKSDRAAGGKANEVGFGLSLEDFVTKSRALKEKTPWEILRQAESVLSPETDSTENVTDMLLLDREYALASRMSDTAVLTQNVTLSGTDQWSDYENSTPFEDVQTGISAVQASIGRRPNTLVLGQPVFNVLVNHPDIVDRMKYSTLGSVTTEMLAKLFNVETVLVASAVQNSSDEGQSDSLAYVWGKHAWLVYVEKQPGLKKVTFGFTFAFDGRKVTKWDDQDEESRYIRVGENYVHEFVAAEAAYFIKNAVA